MSSQNPSLSTDIVFYETFKEEQQAICRYLKKNLRVRFYARPIQEYAHKNPPSDCISVRTQSIIPVTWNHRLKAVFSRSQGYEHLIEYAKKTNFKGSLGYLENYCERSVAEQAVLLMLMLMRKGAKQISQFHSFNRDGLTGEECFGKNACVVGVGNIGKHIVDILRGLKMNVRGVDSVKRVKGLQYSSLTRGINWADIVFCALPLNEKTRNMLGLKSLSSNKKGFYFINVARGEISPAQDLQVLLNKGVLKGVALDVFEDEQILSSYLCKENIRPSAKNKTLLKLAKHNNVVLTPHNAFNTLEALEEKARRSVKSIEFFKREGGFPNPVRWT